MSNYTQPAYHPLEKVIRAAHYLDDHFGKHEYGVQFPGDDHIFRIEETTIPLDMVFVPAPTRGPVTSKKLARHKGNLKAQRIRERDSRKVR